LNSVITIVETELFPCN